MTFALGAPQRGQMIPDPDRFAILIAPSDSLDAHPARPDAGTAALTRGHAVSQ
jgi:hypothetical protein